MQLHEKNRTYIFENSFKSYILVLTLLFFAAIFSYIWLTSYYQQTELQKLEKNLDDILTQEMNKKFALVKAAAVSYANYRVLREAVTYEDRDVIAEEIRPLKAEFFKWTDYKRYAFHFITADGRSLYKSFDEDSYGQDLTDHSMITEVMATGKPSARMGVGGYAQYYRVIAIQPMFALDDANEVIGYVAVSQGLRRLVKDMPNFGYEYSFFEQDKVEEQDPAAQRTYSLDRRSYFENSPLKGYQFKESQLLENRIINAGKYLVYTNQIKDENNRPVAFHAAKISKETFQEMVWQQQKSLLMILGLLLLVVSLVGAFQLRRIKQDIVKPIEEITSNIRNIIDTKDYKQQVQHRMNDEIGELADFFNDLLDTTDQMVFSLKYLNEAVDKTLMVSKTDATGAMTYVNDRFIETTAYSEEELIGSKHNLVRHPETDSEVYTKLWETITAKKTWSGELKCLNKHGETYYVYSHVIPLLDKRNKIIEYMALQEDITLTVELRKQLQDQLVQIEKEKKVAQKANKAKSEFLSSMSHELRTPLNAVIGFSQLLELSELKEAQLKQVKNIKTSGQHLLDLINDILEFAKLDAGKLSLSIEKMSVCSLMDEVFALSQSQAEQVGIKIRVQTECNLDYLVAADRVRLKQVCLNLLSNAVKYNRPGGSVELSWKEAIKDQQSYWKFSVTDTGLGVEQEQLDDLFEPFNRLGHEVSNIEGTGIGLSITKNLIEKMQGWIEVDSEVGQGSTFTIYIPLLEIVESKVESSEEVQQAVQEKVVEAIAPDEQTLRVHYIEDNPANMELMADIISTLEDVDLKISPTAEDGIDQAPSYLPHIMFIDINLPGMDGDEALIYLKELEPLQKMGTKFYALSANVMENQVAKGMDAGFDKYLTKPINIAEVIELIEAAKA